MANAIIESLYLVLYTSIFSLLCGSGSQAYCHPWLMRRWISLTFDFYRLCLFRLFTGLFVEILKVLEYNHNNGQVIK